MNENQEPGSTLSAILDGAADSGVGKTRKNPKVPVIQVTLYPLGSDSWEDDRTLSDQLAEVASRLLRTSVTVSELTGDSEKAKKVFLKMIQSSYAMILAERAQKAAQSN